MTRRFREHDGYIDPVQAFRQASLRKFHASHLVRRKVVPPYRLADHDEPTDLHPALVRYLDGRGEKREWQLLYRELQHQPLQWWADRYAESLT